MIEITYMMPISNQTYRLTVKGHAGYEEPGKFDEVCAAISTLVFTLAQNVKDAHDLGWLRMDPTLKLDEGDSVIKAKPAPGKEVMIATMYTVIVRGLEMVAANYPDNVALTKVLPDLSPTT